VSKVDYKLELLFQLRLLKIEVDHEFCFAPPRKWRADYRVRDSRVLVEFEGGLFAKGKQGHSSVTGILRDIEKYNTAALLGWLVIRVTPKHVVSGEALKWIEQAVDTSQRKQSLVGVGD